MVVIKIVQRKKILDHLGVLLTKNQLISQHWYTNTNTYIDIGALLYPNLFTFVTLPSVSYGRGVATM